MKKYLNYSDVFLIPQKSVLKSRSDADISVEFLGRKYKSPWMPANMSCVINESLARFLSEAGYFYIMHRFNGATESLVKIANDESWKLISISVGVKESDIYLVKKLSALGYNVDIFTIDIAHGHTEFIKSQIDNIKHYFPNAKIIGGNIATADALFYLADCGVDAVKVGIGGGAACSTKNMTGFHIPMFTCVNDIYEKSMFNIEKYRLPIIADGGVRENADFVKALVAGGSMVMAGGVFSACLDAPGDTIIGHDGVKYKIYHGSASEHEKGEKKHVEGFKVELKCNDLTFAAKYGELTESMKSAVSYGGGKDLKCLRDVEWLSIK